TGLGAIATGVLIGINLGYKRIWASLAVISATGVLVWLSLKFEYGLSGVASAHALASVVGVVFLFAALRKNAGWVIHLRPVFAGMGRFFRINIWYAGWTLNNKVHLSCDVILIAMLLSAGAVTQYAVTSFAAITLM